MNFWLTVLTGISDLELEFGFHSSPPVRSELALIYENTMNSIPADKVLKKTPLDLQKLSRFSMRVPNTWRLGIPKERQTFRKDSENVRKTQVDWQRGNVHCVLIQHLENLSNHSYN